MSKPDQTMDLSRSPIHTPGPSRNEANQSSGPAVFRGTLPRLDLLRYAPIRAALRSRLYPAVFQWPTLAAFLLIMAVALVGPAVAHENLGSALTWIVWWPILPLAYLVLGRFWCAVCPFATVNDTVQRYAGLNLRVPPFLKRYGIWIIDLVFILITWADHIWGIVESPRGTGLLLMLITTGVILSAVLFERRTWCRHLCFLGGLSGNYSRAGMLELRAKAEVCATCSEKSCYRGNDSIPGCPIFEFPRTMDSSADCNLCGNCVKTCPNGSLQLTPRLPTRELWFLRHPRFEESFLAVVIVGIVLVQNFTMVSIWQPTLRWAESFLNAGYEPSFTAVFIVAMAMPLGVVYLASRASAWVGTSRGVNPRQKWTENFARFGYALIPLDLAGHLAHNLFHLLAEGKAVLYAAATFLAGGSGIGSMAEAGTDWHGGAALVGMDTIQTLQFILLGLGTLGSLYTAYRIARLGPAHDEGMSRSARGETADSALASLVPHAIVIAFLSFLNVYLFLQPMAHRM